MTWYATLAELAALIHWGHTEICVRVHEHDLERARRGLEKALLARDAARARVVGLELSEQMAEHRELPMVPESLRKVPESCSPPSGS